MSKRCMNPSAVREFIRRSLPVLLIGAALALILNTLLLTITRPQIAPEDEVRIYLVGNNTNAEALAADGERALSAIVGEYPQMRAVSFNDLNYTAAGGYAAETVLQVKLVNGDGDAFLSDEAGLNALLALGSCLPLEELPPGSLPENLPGVERADEDGVMHTAALTIRCPENCGFAADEPLYVSLPANGADPASACRALTALIKEWME